jgi:RHS repeat-associated protein
MDTTIKIDANNLSNLGLDSNLHPLLAATSILPTSLSSAPPSSLYNPTDTFLSLYAPASITTASPLTIPTVQPSEGQNNSISNLVSTALLSTTATKDTLLNPVVTTSSSIAQPAFRTVTAAATVVAAPLQPIHSFAIQAGGIVTFNGNSDLDGNPLDLSDDAFVYAGKGFTLNGNSVLPVQRDAAGNALKDSAGKLRLIDQALVVAPGYIQSSINGNNNYTNLNPPQIVATQTIDVPSYAILKQQELTNRIPVGAVTTTFNIQQNPINNATQWTQKFPPAGTATQPTIVRITNGGLNIPPNVNLSNYVITVDSGDINFNGTSNLTNVVLVATNGNINLNQIQTENTSILASGRINANSTTKLGGNTTIANGTGDITFNGATTGTTSTQNLRVVSQGRITFNGTATVRGDFRSVGTFSTSGSANILGTVASQQDIVFNGNSTFTYTNTGTNDTTPPTITAKLTNDTGASNSDKITSDRTIAGKVTDASAIGALKAGFDTTPAASWLNVTPSIQADGSFTFNPTQLNQIYGGTIPDGTHTIHLSATDIFGNQSQFDYTFTLDTTVAAPSLQLAAASDTGASNSDKITKTDTPTITGTGEIGATIKVSEGTVILGQTTVGTDGKWQVATSALANGTHSLIATATDIAGNISAASAPLSLVIDTLVPQLTLANSITATALKNNAKLTGTVNGTGSNLASISYAWDNSTTLIPITFNATGGFDQGLDFTGISNGAHILTIAATDIAGNLTSTNYNVTVAVDKTAPVITARLATDTGSSNTDKITFNPTVIGTIADASQVTGFKASFDGTNYVNIIAQKQVDGTFTLAKTQLETIAGRTLVDGSYILKLIATDEFGNASPNYDLSFTLDTTIAVPANLKLATASDTGVSNSDKITKINTPTITGTAEIGATIKLTEGTVILGQTTVGTDGNWQVTTSALTDGSHSLIATATDVSGNISTASVPLSLVVDTLVPQLTLTTPIDTNPLQNNAKLIGTINGTGSDLTSINYYWDNSATAIAIATNPTGGFNQGLDFTGINNGAHVLTIAATDLAGNVSTTNYNVTVAVDNQAPVITAKLTTDTGSSNTDKITFNPTIGGTITDASNVTGFEASFDGVNYVNILTQKQADGTFSLAKAQLETIAGKTLVDGNYTLHLLATDEFNNASPNYDLAFTLDTTIAVPANLKLATSSDTGVSNSDRITKINTPTITGTGEIGATIKLIEGTVIVGQTTVVSDGTWQVATSVLTNGTHSLTASAIDIAGNISTASAPLSLVVDTVLPQLTLTNSLTSSPLKNNAKLTGTIDGTGSNLTGINYYWDNSTTAIAIAPFATGGFDQQLDFTGITNGTHTLAISATDVAGNVSTTSYSVNVAVDKQAPVITAKLAADTGSSNTDKITFNPTIAGTVADVNQVTGFKASFDGTNYIDILSQKQADGTFTLAKAQLETIAGKTLVDGNYTLHLIATDEFGNASLSYDTGFILDTTIAVPANLKLATSSDTGASNSDKITNLNTPTITGTGDVGATIKVTEGTVIIGQTTVANDGTWQVATSALTNGSHSLTASAIDIAGNISTASAPLSLAVDTLLPQLTLTNPIDTNPLQNNAKLVGSIDSTGSNLTSINYRWDNSTTLIPLVPNANGGFNQGLDFTGINNGTHTIAIIAIDVAGNILTSNYSVNVNLDKTAPIVNFQLATDSGSSSDLITNNPTITGKVTDPSGVSAVNISLNANFTNNVNITASLQADGSFSLDKATLTQLNGGTLPDGTYQVYLQAIDNFGNTTTPQSLTFQLLTSAILPTNLQLQAGSDTGISNSDKITTNNQPTIQGNGKAGDTIQLLEGTTLLGQTTVASNGTWQLNSNALTDGTHNLTATAIDIAGNTSPSSTALRIDIDTVVPNLQLSQQLAGIVLTGSSRLAGQVTDTNINTISYQFDGAPAITLPNFAGGTPGTFDTPFDFTGINDGGHNLTVTATDIAGNSVARTYGVTVARGNLLTIALLEDTGISNSDGITSNINVRGQVADRTRISRLEFSLDGNTNYSDLTAALQLDGTFRLLPAQLNSLAGGTLNLGTHSLAVRGVLADGVPVATATLNFTYTNANLDRPSLALTKASDSGVIGDLVTSAASVDLIAKAAAGSSVKLGTQTLVADINGIATFTGINLNLGANNFTLTTTNSQGELATSTTTITRTNPDDVILTWNHIALAAIQRENTPPPAAARLLGMVHTAMYDAVNAIEQKYGVYRVDASAPTGADEIAAAAQAAARVLKAIYPNQQAYFNTALENSLLNGATAADRAAGVAVGDTVAANILAWRQQDGSRNPAAFNPTTAIGDWQPDLPNYDGALLPQWGKVTTFGLTSGSQFRPAGDPSLTSAEYTSAFTETKNYGSRDGSLRSADNTQSALFWADGNGTFTPAGHWNDIAATSASIAGKSILDNARLFAQLNIALADAGIAAWDSKYAFNTWRPITAIRQADKDGNPLTSADPNWVPLINTPPFPEYVSGHSTFSAAAAAVLSNTFGNTFAFNSGSAGLPNVTRSFTSFDAAAIEAGQSRIYGGIHFQFSNQDGLALGKKIGDYVVNNLLVDNSLNQIQVSLTTDTAAFGTTNRDRITTTAGITGKVNLNQPNLKLQVALANGTFVDITSSLDGSGNFQLDATKLTTILGTLTDKAYQLTFKLLDASNATVSTNNLSFILDTTAAQATLNPLTGTVTPTVHLTGTATDGNGGTSGRFKVDGGSWTSFAVQPNGNFNKVINAQGLTAGIHTVNVELADLAGNITAQSVSFSVDNGSNIYASPATNPGWGRVFGTGFSLAEGNSLVTQNSIDIALGGNGKRTLDFDLVTNFDKSDVKSFGKDRVAVYLVDSSNNPIAIDSTHPGGVPLFSLSETGSEIIPGLVKFDGTHVQIDVSNVAATSGKLVIQLLNQDGDSGTNLTLTNFVDAIDPTGTPGTSVSPAITPVTPGAATILDSYLATSTAQLLLSNVSLDKATGKYTADLRVQNVGTTTLSQNLAVLLTQLPAGVTVANGSGTHPTGAPYLNFNTAIAPGGLSGGAISDAIRVVINDPTLVAFSFKPVVLQGAAAPLPDLSSLSVLTVKVGDKIDIPLAGELAIKTGVKLPTGAITGDSHLVFTPAPDQVGSYSFTLIARNGGTETTQNVTLNVVADPITTTRVTGIIADTSQAGLAGVLVELSGYQATTDATGKFTIVLPDSSAGDTLKVYGQRIQGGGITYPFIAEKMGLLLGHEIYRSVNNQIDRPIYLPTVDVSTGTTVNPGAETFVTNPRLAGAKVDVAAGSLFDKSGNAFAGIMTITEVPVSLTPAALPDNLHPDVIVTIQPGDMVFNTPARLTLPNRAGYLPGVEMDLWSINPNTGLFDIVGKGQVSADGSVIETIEGGIRNSSWHFFAPPPPKIDFDLENPSNQDPNKDGCEAKYPYKSEVSGFSGAVSDNRALVSYQSQGTAHGVNLHYDSLRANPNQIIHVGGQFSAITPTDSLSTKITLITNGISQTVTGLKSAQLSGLSGGERMWSLPTTGTALDTSMQVDLSHLASGRYQYQINTGIRGIRSWISGFNIFSGNFIATRALIGTTSSRQDKLVVVNDSNSVFGSGWNVSGLQKLVVNEDRSVLLIDGDGTQQIFSSVLVPSLPANTPKTYQSAAGDYSQLIRLADGTFQRTMKDGTRYQFDAQGLMVAATDKQENTTRHIYNASGQIQQIVDPVGLTTTFNYTGNRVTSIVDPAGRITKMEYDSQGNLVSVTDPDATKNLYGYDSRHLITSSTDKTGQVKTGTYDEFGRAKTAQREDGTIVEINPIEVQGLLNQQKTTNLAGLPTAQLLNANPISTYVDGNGNPVSSQLDKKGHIKSSTDSIGANTTNIRDAAGQITREIDARGNVIDYSYDQQGNVVAVTERVDANISTLNPSSISREIENIKSSISVSAAGSYKVVTTGDINNDGYLDIITTADNRKLNVLLGDAANSFTNTYIIDISAYTQSDVNQLELKDVNNDDKLDLIANLSNYGLINSGYGYGYGEPNIVTPLNPILVLINQGNGQFANTSIQTLATESAGFLTGDFNGDGKVDILVRAESYSARVNNVNLLALYAGDGTGNFIQQSITIPAIDTSSPFYYGGFQTAAGDFNGDGKTEVVFNLYDRLSICSYDSSGNWSEMYRNSSDFDISRSKFTVGDLNNDGKLDIVTAGYYGSIELLLGQNDGSFQSQTTNHSNNNYVSDLKIVNFNRDPRPDLVIVNNNNLVETYSLGSDRQLAQLEIPFQIQFPGAYRGMADIDRNGNLDFLWESSNSTIEFINSYPKYQPYQANVTSYNIPGQTVTKSYTYDTKFNQLTSVTDELGRKTLYDIDTNTGNVLKTTRVVGLLDTDSSETNDVITSYTYTSTGQLDTVTDALLHITDYDYDTYGNLTKTTTAKGTYDQTVEQYEYDASGNRTASIDALERKTKYIYNSTNMLLQTIDALGGTTTYNYDKMGHQTKVTDALGHVTSMTYDVRGRLIGTIDANDTVSTNAYDNNGNLVAIKDPLNRMTSYRYDARNRLIGTIAADGGITGATYDLNNNLAIATDSLGHTTRKFYDSRNRLSWEVDALGNETKYGYDAANQLTQITDPKGNITIYQYDELGRQTAEFRGLTFTVTGSDINADGYATRTEYDKLGNVTATIDANGNPTDYTYDALNRRISVKDAQSALTLTGYDKVGNVLSVTDALNRITSYAYDALDRQTVVTDALGHTSTTAYDAVGNAIATTDALNRTTSYSYDNLNRQILTKDALNQTQSVSYDKVGNVLRTTDELGRITSYGYDTLNRQTSITDPLLHTSTTSYDTEGNVTSTTDALGNITRYLYDRNNRQIQAIDAKLGVTKTSYDRVGNVASITDSVNNVTSYGYDALDRLITDTNQLGKTRTYSYDNVGNLTQTIDRDGRKIAYTYDTLNRQTAERWLDASGATVKTFSSGYDAVGHLLSSTNPDSKYSYTYDAVDRVSSIDNTDTVGVLAVKFNYTYDAVGNLLTVNDSINGTSAGITGYSYDLLNRVTRLTQGGSGVQSKRIDMAYNAVNQLTGLSRYSGAVNVADTSYTYDDNQRLIQLSHKKGASTISSYGYDYDVADKLARTVSSADGTSDYSYDPTNQLIGADNTIQPDEAYSYDANGNRTIAGYATGANNQLLSDGTHNYTYDGEGNRTRRVEIATGKVTEYVWDYRNRLASVLFKDAGGSVSKTIDYIYDGNNQRIGKRIDGAVTERYVIDRNQIALVFDGAGTQTHRYLYGTQVDQVLADEIGVSTNWMLGDNQGSIRDVVDSNGSLIDHVVYDSFGKVQSQSNAGYDLKFGYTGREQDNETGLDYYRARYYDAGNGRFISEDPIGFDGGDTNLTRYTRNSPINYTDPSGLYGEVTKYNRNIIYSPTREAIPTDIVSVLAAGYLIPVQLRFSLFSSNFPSAHFVDADPKIPQRNRDPVAARIFSDVTNAEIKYTNQESGGRASEAWGGKYGGDENGHIIPKLLGGSNQAYNIFSQNPSINAGSYNQYGIALSTYLTKLEEKRKRCGGEPPKLDLKVDLKHYYGLRERDKRIRKFYALRPNEVETEARFSDGAISRGKFSNFTGARSGGGTFDPLPQNP